MTGKASEGSTSLFPYITPAILVLAVLSPKLDRPITGLRVEDILTPIALLWIVSRGGGPRLLRALPSFPLIILIAASLSTIIGLAIGTSRPLPAFLTTAKALEYIVLYTMAAAFKPPRRLLIAVIEILGAVVAFAAVFELAAGRIIHGPEAVIRPFTGGPWHGETNHMAGFLLIVFALSLGGAGSAGEAGEGPSLRRLLSAAVMALGIFATGSRGALAALIAALVIGAFARSRRHGLAAIAASIIVIAAAANDPGHRLLLPARAAPYIGPHLDRAEAWGLAINESLEIPILGPLLGLGLGARPSGVYENQLVMLFAETGLLGLALVLAWSLSFTAAVARSERGLYLAAVALAVFSFGANVLVISRIMVPLTVISGSLIFHDAEARPA